MDSVSDDRKQLSLLYHKTLSTYGGNLWNLKDNAVDLKFNETDTFLAISQDGATVAISGEEGILIVKDLAGSNLIFDLIIDENNESSNQEDDDSTVENNQINFACLSPSGTRMLLNKNDTPSTFHFVDFTTGITLIVNKEDKITAMCFLLDGNYFALGTSNGVVTVYEFVASTEDEEEKSSNGAFESSIRIVRNQKLHNKAVTILVPSSNGVGLLASYAKDHSMCIWTLHDNRVVVVYPSFSITDIEMDLCALKFSLDNAGLIGVYGDGTIMEWEKDNYIWRTYGENNTVSDSSSQSLDDSKSQEIYISSADFSWDRKTVLLGYIDGSVKLYNQDTDQAVLLKKAGTKLDRVHKVSFSRSDRNITSIFGSPLKIKHWEKNTLPQRPSSSSIQLPAEDKCQATKPLPQLKSSLEFYLVALSPDKKVFAKVGSDYAIYVWQNADSVTCFRLQNAFRVFRGHITKITALAISDRNMIISGSYNGCVRVWNVESGQQFIIPLRYEVGIHSVAISGKSIAVATKHSYTPRSYTPIIHWRLLSDEMKEGTIPLNSSNIQKTLCIYEHYHQHIDMRTARRPFNFFSGVVPEKYVYIFCLSSPNVVSIYECAPKKTKPIFTMEITSSSEISFLTVSHMKLLLGTSNGNIRIFSNLLRQLPFINPRTQKKDGLNLDVQRGVIPSKSYISFMTISKDEKYLATISTEDINIYKFLENNKLMHYANIKKPYFKDMRDFPNIVNSAFFTADNTYLCVLSTVRSAMHIKIKPNIKNLTTKLQNICVKLVNKKRNTKKNSSIESFDQLSTDDIKEIGITEFVKALNSTNMNNINSFLLTHSESKDQSLLQQINNKKQRKTKRDYVPLLKRVLEKMIPERTGEKQPDKDKTRQSKPLPPPKKSPPSVGGNFSSSESDDSSSDGF